MNVYYFTLSKIKRSSLHILIFNFLCRFGIVHLVCLLLLVFLLHLFSLFICFLPRNLFTCIFSFKSLSAFFFDLILCEFVLVEFICFMDASMLFTLQLSSFKLVISTVLTLGGLAFLVRIGCKPQPQVLP